MKWLRQVFNFYINSSIHVALAVSCFTLITLNQLHLPFSQNLLLFIFFGTITGYNFVKYAGVAKLHHHRLTESLKVIQLFSLLCFCLWVYYLWQLEMRMVIACIPLGLLTILYALPIFPRKTNLRMVPSIKIFVIAAVWAGTTVYLPVIYENTKWDWDITLMLIQRFMIVLALTLPFEIRDLKFDETELGTLPQLLGIDKTKRLGYLLLLTTLFLEFLKDDLQIYLIMSLSIFIGIGIYLAKRNQSRYYASFWVEGIPILCWLILWSI